MELLTDPCSLANFGDFKTVHLEWDITVHFHEQILACTARYLLERVDKTKTHLVLDTNGVIVEQVQVNGEDVIFELLAAVSCFGRPLQIHLPASVINGFNQSFLAAIKYKTSMDASALQWLAPEQTLGKVKPYTQCQAIHARSIVPCQDTPSCKITYNAQVTVDEDLVALMSAVKGKEVLHGNGKKTCYFEQKIKTPSYLLALAVGDIVSRQVGPRSKVWSEPAMVEACADEFAEVEKMLQAAESLMGPYVWGDYDLLILPPSFPYGGMENPCLTFATPTVVAGDRSLTSLAVHEITHSWTGNLVTNANWEHFWLNEGFTRFLEGKILGIIYGESTRQFAAIGGWAHLADDVERFGATHPLTALVPTLRNVDPDDAFSTVPYEKGYAFLYYIESLVGGPSVFNPFLRTYIEHFKFKTLVTENFKQFLLGYFKDKSAELGAIDWDAWLHAPGMPPVNVIDMYDTSLADACESLCSKWIRASESDLSSFSPEEFQTFSSAQKIDFLSKLFQKPSLPLSSLKHMTSVYQLVTNRNAEIRFGFLRLCVRAEWQEMYPEVVYFLSEQGRMKFVRPLYREMFKNASSRDLAVQTFEKYRHTYHKIASTMISKDLGVAQS